MEQVRAVLQASLLWQIVNSICTWCGKQWEKSAIVHWFLNPVGWVRESSERSIFFRLWSALRRGLCCLYEKLKLEKLFAGSVFLNTCFWCCLPFVLAPLVPTVLVMGLAGVGFCALALALLREKDRALSWSPIHRYILIYSAIYLVSIFISANVKGSLKHGLLMVFFMLFSLAISNAVQNRSQLDGLVFFLVLAGTAVAFYGICQYLFGWGYQSAAWVDSDMFSDITFRAPSTLENPNMLGQYLTLIIPLGGAKLLASKKWSDRILYFVCCAIMCICMILTFSRGAWLGLLFAGAIFFIFMNPRFILLVPVCLVALYFVLPDTVISRFTSIGNLGDNSTSYRVSIWMGTLAMLKDYWLCGVGPGTEAFNMVYPAYSYHGIVAPHAHNLFLQIVCDLGIIGLIIFILLIFVYGRMLCRALSREKDQTSRLLQLATLGGAMGFLVQAMTDYSFYNYRVMFLFWAYLVLGGLAARRSELPAGRETK